MKLTDKLLLAIKNGDMHSEIVDGRIQILVDLKTVLTLDADPLPQVRKGLDNSVAVGDIRVECESELDAETIAGSLSALIEVAK